MILKYECIDLFHNSAFYPSQHLGIPCSYITYIRVKERKFVSSRPFIVYANECEIEIIQLINNILYIIYNTFQPSTVPTT